MKRYINTVKTLLKIADGKIFLVIQMFISCGLYNLSGLLPPIATSGIIAVISNNNFNGIWYYVCLYVVFYILYYSTLHWNYHTSAVLADYYHLKVQKKLFDHVANNDTIFNKISKGKIVDTCSDDVRYLIDVLDSFSEAMMQFIELVVIFIVFSYYNVFAALIALLINTLYLILMNYNSKRISKYFEGTRKYEDKILDIFNQMIVNLKQVKSLNIMPNLNKKLDKTRKRWSIEFESESKATITRYCKLPYIVYGGKILLYIFLSYLVIEKVMTIDKLVLLISYFELTITCSENMSSYLLDLSNYGIRVKRIKNILDYTQESNMDFGDIDNDYINGTVVFDKVTYKIKRNTILDKVSFKVYPNEITAIVGHSGSGKTTIMNLLYRLDRVKSGSILIDDESIYNYTKKVYASNVSGVFQRPFVFDMSIRDNLSLTDSDHNNQIEVCKRLGIHDFIMSLPKGYNTVITEDGRLLTDGQKQLLSIARALLSKAEILLFDEITSNIDSKSTVEICEVLKDLKQDHTVIIITHKSEIMDVADRVVVLDNGKVVDSGKNSAVLKRSSLYRNLKNRTFASLSTNE